MRPYRGMVFDNRPVAPVFLDSSPVSDGVAQFATALIQAPMMKQQIQSQRGAAAAEAAFKQRQMEHQQRMDEMANMFRRRELDLKEKGLDKSKAPKIHWRQNYGETGLPEGAPVPYVMGPDGRLQEVPIGPDAPAAPPPAPVDRSVYPDGEFTWYNPADWWRGATAGGAAPEAGPAPQAPAPEPAQPAAPAPAATPRPANYAMPDPSSQPSEASAAPGWMESLLQYVTPERSSYQPYLDYFQGGGSSAPTAPPVPAEQPEAAPAMAGNQEPGTAPATDPQRIQREYLDVAGVQRPTPEFRSAVQQWHALAMQAIAGDQEAAAAVRQLNRSDRHASDFFRWFNQRRRQN